MCVGSLIGRRGWAGPQPAQLACRTLRKLAPSAVRSPSCTRCTPPGCPQWVGILSEGLRIAPPSAPVTGYMFGKGVYFADMVSKSANYCFARCVAGGTFCHGAPCWAALCTAHNANRAGGWWVVPRARRPAVAGRRVWVGVPLYLFVWSRGALVLQLFVAERAADALGSRSGQHA